jgi:hypothetical protein
MFREVGDVVVRVEIRVRADDVVVREVCGAYISPLLVIAPEGLA